MWFCLAVCATIASAAQSAEIARVKTNDAVLGLDDRGNLCTVVMASDDRELLAPDQTSPVLQAYVGGKLLSPSGATWNAGAHRLTLQYGDAGVEIVVKITAKPSHIVLEVVDVRPVEKVELVVWGPYASTIGEMVGEVVGVARDSNVAIGIQALNAKTIGGYPDIDKVRRPLTMDDPARYADLPSELNKSQSYRGDTALPTQFGSVLQAYCRDRSKPRVAAISGFAHYPVAAFDDGGIRGSKIALFACPVAKTLDSLEAIELAEGLPHPTIDGQWAKRSPRANVSYLIVDFSEATIDRAIELTKQAGLSCVYHSSPFETWGHFRLNPKLFPHGVEGLKACVEKAKKQGITVGFHTLSNFTTPNDPYVSPRPDPRLARSGISKLTRDVSANDTEIDVERIEPFQKKTVLNTVVIGDELVEYAGTSTAAPWRLLNCRRGAWGTKPAEHRAGDAVGKLFDHDYKVFLTNASLSIEEARNLAALCNATGVRRISMDGLEGNFSTGYGQYGAVLFAKAWYDRLDPSLRGRVWCDASMPAHFNWHINTYYNWGEPWYAGFRQSQTLYRFKNQLFYTRNLLPRMLGWFSLRNDTTLADAEWLLARAAGFDAGFTLTVSPDSVAHQQAASTDSTATNRSTAAILAAIREWETARLAGAFPDDIKAKLRDNNREFHLEPAGRNRWDLFEVKDGRRGEPIRIERK